MLRLQEVKPPVYCYCQVCRDATSQLMSNPRRAFRARLKEWGKVPPGSGLGVGVSPCLEGLMLALIVPFCRLVKILI